LTSLRNSALNTLGFFAERNHEKFHSSACTIPNQPARKRMTLMISQIFNWQHMKFHDALPKSQQTHFGAEIGPLIADNFTLQPSSGPAFVQLASQFFEELARNSKRLPELGKLDMPVTVIWGEYDPYITKDVGADRASHFKRASLHVLPAGHWLQADMPDQVARLMLS
jgi:haloalkane dehalogenase